MSVVKLLQQCTEYKWLNEEEVHYACEGKKAEGLFFFSFKTDPSANLICFVCITITIG